MSTSPSDPTYFFVHVMKTGGTTFAQHFARNFRPEQVYPNVEPGAERLRAYYMIDELRALTAPQRAAIRVYSGHFPFAASTLVGADVTMTILRDPVERTLSYLRHRKRYHEDQRDASLEAIYEDAWVFPCYLHNYQVKLFAMTPDDKLESHLDVVDVDAERLEIAKANLDRVDVLGLNDRYDEFVDEMRARYGWTFGPAPNLRVSTEERETSEAFRRRIAVENAADVAFFQYACEQYERRRRS